MQPVPLNVRKSATCVFKCGEKCNLCLLMWGKVQHVPLNMKNSAEFAFKRGEKYTENRNECLCTYNHGALYTSIIVITVAPGADDQVS